MSDAMARISNVDAVEKARVIRPLTEVNERECLARLAAEVSPKGKIVEIGCLYGGMTAVIGLANPLVFVISIDDFSWHPSDDVPTSKELLYENMKKMGISIVTVIEGDSRQLGPKWKELSKELFKQVDLEDKSHSEIDLLWIDGGHSLDYVLADLSNFGPFAQVIAVHDYDNPHWMSIRMAVKHFIEENPEWSIAEVVGTVAVLRK